MEGITSLGEVPRRPRAVGKGQRSGGESSYNLMFLFSHGMKQKQLWKRGKRGKDRPMKPSAQHARKQPGKESGSDAWLGMKSEKPCREATKTSHISSLCASSLGHTLNQTEPGLSHRSQPPYRLSAEVTEVKPEFTTSQFYLWGCVQMRTEIYLNTVPDCSNNSTTTIRKLNILSLCSKIMEISN